MQLIENNIHTYSFNGDHPTHASSLVDIQLFLLRGFGISMDQGA